jgi:hypothetical protein
VREAVSRGRRLVPPLAKVALDPDNWDRGDGAWCSAIHACFLLAAIGGDEAAGALLRAFDIAEDAENDWLDEEWASMFGSLGPSVIPALRERALRDGADIYWRHHALCGMAAVALHHPDRKPEVLAFIAGIAGKEDHDPAIRIWAGNILLDFHSKEHEALILSLADLPDNDVFDEQDARAVFSRDLDLHWYDHDWLDFYSPAKLASRRKRWEAERLTESQAWLAAMIDWQAGDEEALPVSRKRAEKEIGALMPLVLKGKQAIEAYAETPSKERLIEHYGIAMELFAAVLQDRSRLRLIETCLADLFHWLLSLTTDLAGAGLADEAARLSEAWADLGEPEEFLGDRAVILARAGHEADAREQIETNLKLFAREFWIQVKAGDAYRALKDWPKAEERYRLSRAIATTEFDRAEARLRIVELLRESGKSSEADALEAEEAERIERERVRAESERASRAPLVREGPKIGRNDPCPCGSGRKHKKCCLGSEAVTS